MKALLGRALLRYRGSAELALDDLAWGFRQYIRDPRDPFKPLGRLARTREEYGRAPADFRSPFRREDVLPKRPTFDVGELAREASPTEATTATSAARTGAISGGGAAAPAPVRRSVLELARIDLARARDALERGFGSLRAVEKADRLVRELEAKEDRT